MYEFQRDASVAFIAGKVHGDGESTPQTPKLGVESRSRVEKKNLNRTPVIPEK